MTGLAKQWLWALSWLAVTAALILSGWKLDLPWAASPALFTAVVIPLTPASWRDEG